MKLIDVQKDYMQSDIIRQLHKLGFTETKGLSYRELVHKLAVERAKDVKVGSPHSGWF